MKMIIQNKHYFTTSLLTSEPKCNFRATNPALNCNLLCLKRVADSHCFDDLDVYVHLILQFICRVATWSQCHPYPRGGIITSNFLSSMPAAISGLGRLVKALLTIRDGHYATFRTLI